MIPDGAAALPRFVTYSTGMNVRFRGLRERDGALLRGPAGWGEFSPFHEYDDAISASWLAAAIEAATEGFPQPVRDSVPVNVTIPACSPQRAAEIALRGGCGTAKVKVAEAGHRLEDDLNRVAAVREAMGSAVKIRIDANGAWSREDAIAAIPALDAAAGGLEYVEQPCASVEDLAAVRRTVDVRIAADESIRRAEDPMRVVRAEAADIAVLKVQPLGGVRRCLELAAETGLPVVVSSALESSVGIAMGVALAAALPELEFACGLATVHLFDRDVTENPLVPINGALPVRRVEPDGVLARREVQRDDWWRRRALRASEHLTYKQHAALLELLAHD